MFRCAHVLPAVSSLLLGAMVGPLAAMRLHQESANNLDKGDFWTQVDEEVAREYLNKLTEDVANKLEKDDFWTQADKEAKEYLNKVTVENNLEKDEFWRQVDEEVAKDYLNKVTEDAMAELEKEPKEELIKEPSSDDKEEVIEERVEEDVPQEPTKDLTTEDGQEKKLVAEDVPAQDKAEEDTRTQEEKVQHSEPAQPITPPPGSRCCCADEKYCRFYPKELLIKSWTPSFKRAFTSVWKKTCPVLCNEGNGKRCACKRKDATKDCQKTSHAFDEFCQDGQGDSILFEGEACAA